VKFEVLLETLKSHYALPYIEDEGILSLQIVGTFNQTTQRRVSRDCNLDLQTNHLLSRKVQGYRKRWTGFETAIT